MIWLITIAAAILALSLPIALSYRRARIRREALIARRRQKGESK